MRAQDIRNVLDSNQAVAWFRNRDGRIICAAPHVEAAILSIDPKRTPWERLTPEQVRDAISHNRKLNVGGAALSEPEVAATAPALAGPGSTEGGAPSARLDDFVHAPAAAAKVNKKK